MGIASADRGQGGHRLRFPVLLEGLSAMVRILDAQRRGQGQLLSAAQKELGERPGRQGN